ncbi:hypothetical protein GJ496_002468 [Pomphorhynchus laevis]|nr:hypothetical protein GJ496_002468 [Pomphorhynchus laevis]
MEFDSLLTSSRINIVNDLDKAKAIFYKTNIPAIDNAIYTKLKHPGFIKGGIYGVFGEQGSFKTELCAQLYKIYGSVHNVVYFDCEQNHLKTRDISNGYSVSSLTQLIAQLRQLAEIASTDICMIDNINRISQLEDNQIQSYKLLAIIRQTVIGMSCSGCTILITDQIKCNFKDHSLSPHILTCPSFESMFTAIMKLATNSKPDDANPLDIQKGRQCTNCFAVNCSNRAHLVSHHNYSADTNSKDVRIQTGDVEVGMEHIITCSTESCPCMVKVWLPRLLPRGFIKNKVLCPYCSAMQFEMLITETSALRREITELKKYSKRKSYSKSIIACLSYT